MYAYIMGRVADKQAGVITIDANGVGYEILCTASALSNAPQLGEEYKVYTFLNVREDAQELYGFYSREEKSLFLRLTTVTGIGPKTALGILSSMPLKDLTLALMTGDITTLSRAPGIGKKTAQRMALELKDKLSADDVDLVAGMQPIASAAVHSSAMSEAMQALQGLGYTQTEAARALDEARKTGADTEKADDLVRFALRGMMKG